MENINHRNGPKYLLINAPSSITDMVFYSALVCFGLVLIGLINGSQIKGTTFPVSEYDDDLPMTSPKRAKEMISEEKRNIRCPPMSRFWSYIPCYRKKQPKDMTKSELIAQIKKYIMKHYKSPK